MLVCQGFDRWFLSAPMQSLLVPVLAQLLTVGTGAQSELRYVASENDQRFESASSAGVAVGLDLPYLKLEATYAPSVTVSPLEREPRVVTPSDSLTGSAKAQYDFRFKRSTFSISQSASYTRENPFFQALNAPPPVPRAAPPATPTPAPDEEPEGPTAPEPADGTTNPAVDARPASDYRVQTWLLRSGLAFNSSLARKTVLLSDVNYQLTAGLGDSRPDYPLVQGPDGRVELGYRVTPRGTLTTTLGAQYGWAEPGTRSPEVNKALISGLSLRYYYRFTRRTNGDAGVGVAYTQSQRGNGVITHSVFPVATAGVDHSTRWHKGSLTLAARATSAPVIDITTAAIDPRVGISLLGAWNRRRFSLNVDVNTTISVGGADTNQAALNSVSANLTARYELGAGFQAEAGARSAWQTFNDDPIIPAEGTIFAGLSWAFGTTYGAPPAVR
jgi:hypothetical protein